MRFDLALKKVITTNVNLFGHLMQYFDQTPGPNHAFLASLCKVGYQNNFFIGKTVEKMEFVPGDAESEENEQRILGEVIDDNQEASIISPKLIEKVDNDRKSFEEFMRIINTEDYPVIEYKEKDGTADKNETVGNTGELGSLDWYRKLFSQSGESLPGEIGPSTDSPESGKGEEGK